MSSIWVVQLAAALVHESDRLRHPQGAAYRPTPSESISCTTGSNGMRSSTGGSSPAATRAASIGASLNPPAHRRTGASAGGALCSASPVANASADAISRAALLQPSPCHQCLRHGHPLGLDSIRLSGSINHPHRPIQESNQNTPRRTQEWPCGRPHAQPNGSRSTRRG